MNRMIGKGIMPRDRKASWKNLRVGDRVRFVRMPTFEGVAGGGPLPETKQLYKRLIARSRPPRVFQIDEYRLPWIQCRFRRKDGKWEHHWLAINDRYQWATPVAHERREAG
jgi:hypothetical protein